MKFFLSILIFCAALWPSKNFAQHSPAFVGTVAKARVVASGGGGAADGIVGYWNLDEASGTRSDSVGTNHFADNNTVGSETGVAGNAAAFVSANSEYLAATSISDALKMGDKDFTLCLWLKRPDNGSLPVICWGSSSANRDFVVTWNFSGTFSITAYDAAGNATTKVSTSGTTVSNTFHFVCVQHDSANDKITFRLNDGTKEEFAYSAGIRNLSTELRLGRNEFSTYYNGAVDDVSFWNRVLSDSEVSEWKSQPGEHGL